jgi:hypothetical protein
MTPMSKSTMRRHYNRLKCLQGSRLPIAPIRANARPIPPPCLNLEPATESSSQRSILSRGRLTPVQSPTYRSCLSTKRKVAEDFRFIIARLMRRTRITVAASASIGGPSCMVGRNLSLERGN